MQIDGSDDGEMNWDDDKEEEEEEYLCFCLIKVDWNAFKLRRKKK